MVNKTIIDKNVEIKENVQIGSGSDFTINSDAENTLENGLNLIAKDITIAKNIRIHRNCRINRDIAADEFENNEVLSGTTLNGLLKIIDFN
jgi:glucose-1-phosphate adenylyltransferase